MDGVVLFFQISKWTDNNIEMLSLCSKTFATGRVSMMLFMKKVDFFDYMLQKLIHLGIFHIM